jgi:hypothetical protein
VPIPLGVTYPFVCGRFDRAVGTQVALSGFTCSVVDESDRSTERSPPIADPPARRRWRRYPEQPLGSPLN